jgi:hypothetical protein
MDSRVPLDLQPINALGEQRELICAVCGLRALVEIDELIPVPDDYQRYVRIVHVAPEAHQLLTPAAPRSEGIIFG